MARDRDLFWKLVEPEHLRARAFCRRLTRNREDGDDLYQDALVRGLTRIGSLRDRAAFRAWFYRIIISTFRNRYRACRHRVEVELSPELAAEVPGEHSAQGIARRRVAVAMSALKPKERILVTLRDLEGWSLPELAKMMHKSEGAVRVALSRAHRKMRKRLQHYLRARVTEPARSGLASEVALCAVRKRNEE